MIFEAGWLSAGVAWLMTYYVDCPVENARETVLGEYKTNQYFFQNLRTVHGHMGYHRYHLRCWLQSVTN